MLEDPGDSRRCVEHGDQPDAAQPNPEGLAQAFIIGRDLVGTDRVALAVAAQITPAKRALHAAGATEPLIWMHGGLPTVVPGGGLQVGFWLEIRDADKLGPGWRIFSHVVNAKGEILANGEARLTLALPPAADKPIRYYKVAYPGLPPNATAVAFGLLRVTDAGLEFL